MRQVPKIKPRHITLLTSVGAGLEYYDYVIFYLLTSFISQQFFPSSNHTAALFATFSIFVASNIIRPIGGTLIGILGDRFGRKNVFANTLLIMALATFLIGCLPSFSHFGIVTTILFSLLLIIQGITFGAELPGAITFLLEHIQEKKRGLHIGFLIAAVGLGVALGSLVIFLLTKFLSNKEMFAWGFRIPFFLGGFLALIGFFIRRKISETPLFTALKERPKNVILHIRRNYRAQLMKGIGMILFPAAFVTFFLVLPVYLHDIYHYQMSTIYSMTTFGYLWSAFLLPIFGRLSDSMGQKLLFKIALVSIIVLVIPLFGLLELETTWALFIFTALYQTVIAMMAACYFVLLPSSFPTEIRYTGTAFSYNIAFTIAALIPLVANYFYAILHLSILIPLLFVGLAVITLWSVKMNYEL